MDLNAKMSKSKKKKLKKREKRNQQLMEDALKHVNKDENGLELPEEDCNGHMEEDQKSEKSSKSEVKCILGFILMQNHLIFSYYFREKRFIIFFLAET